MLRPSSQHGSVKIGTAGWPDMLSVMYIGTKQQHRNSRMSPRLRNVGLTFCRPRDRGREPKDESKSNMSLSEGKQAVLGFCQWFKLNFLGTPLWGSLRLWGVKLRLVTLSRWAFRILLNFFRLAGGKGEPGLGKGDGY